MRVRVRVGVKGKGEGEVGTELGLTLGLRG